LLEPGSLARMFQRFENAPVAGLAVSGGVDSIALMRLAEAWVKQRTAAGRPAPVFTVLTVDHGLRPGSADEAQLVARWASEIGLAHETLTWVGEKPTHGIQAAARDARYGLLCGWALERGVGIPVAVAHHRSDQAETVLMRLARGSGPDGLAAMRAEVVRDGVPIVRPLLETSKRDLVELVRDYLGARWIDDPSNQSVAFERVRLRAVQDELAAAGLDDAALARTARRMARAVEGLEAATTQFLAELGARQPFLHAGGFVWPCRPQDVADEIYIRALGRVLMTAGGTDEPVSLASLERLAIELALPGFSGATLGRCRVLPWPADQAQAAGMQAPDLWVLVVRETGREPLPALEISGARTVRWDNRFVVTADAGLDCAIMVRAVDERALGEISEANAGQADVLGRGVPLPDVIQRGIPAFWSGDRLLAIPSFDVYEPGSTGAGGSVSTKYSVAFMVDRLKGAGGGAKSLTDVNTALNGPV